MTPMQAGALDGVKVLEFSEMIAAPFAGMHLGSAPTTREGDRDVAAAHSAVRVLVVTAREALSVLAEVRRLVLHQGD